MRRQEHTRSDARSDIIGDARSKKNKHAKRHSFNQDTGHTFASRCAPCPRACGRSRGCGLDVLFLMFPPRGACDVWREHDCSNVVLTLVFSPFTRGEGGGMG